MLPTQDILAHPNINPATHLGYQCQHWSLPSRLADTDLLLASPNSPVRLDPLPLPLLLSLSLSLSLSLFLCFFVYFWSVDLASSFLVLSYLATKKMEEIMNILNEVDILLCLCLCLDLDLDFNFKFFGSMLVFSILCICWNLGLCSWICALVFLILCLCLNLGLCSWACTFVFGLVPWMDLGWFHWRRWDFIGLCFCILEHLVFNFFGFVFLVVSCFIFVFVLYFDYVLYFLI